MPAQFEKCVNDGGKVRRVSGPNEEHGLAKDEYVNYCTINGETYRGEVKKVKKNSEFKVKSLIHRIDIGDSFAEASKDNPMSEIEVLHEGYWEHDAYGEVAITEEDIDKFIQNFNSKTRKIDIAVDMDHQPEKGALGWFRDLKKVYEEGKAKLKAVIEWTSLGVEMIEKGIYKYFSPEFYFEYEDPETHEVYENVLMGGGLTNRPYFKNLAPVQLSENISIDIDSIKLQEKKGGEERMTRREELLAELEENQDYELPEDASEEDKALLEELKSEEESEEDEELDEEAGEEEDKPVESEDEEEDEEPVEANEVSAKEFNAVKSELGVLKKKLKFKEAEERIEGYTFSESNQDGRLLPKSKKVAHKLLMSLTPRQVKMFDEFVNSLPKMDTVVFEEMGGEGDSVKASEELGNKVTEFMKEHEGMTYGQALKRVSADNPELVEKARLGE